MDSITSNFLPGGSLYSREHLNAATGRKAELPFPDGCLSYRERTGEFVMKEAEKRKKISETAFMKKAVPADYAGQGNHGDYAEQGNQADYAGNELPSVHAAHGDIAYQNKDITSKLLAENFGGKSFRVYGLDIPEVKAVLPTNIPTVRANELRLDNLFELADGTAALVDYESEYKKEDKVKYLNYLTGIANRYQKQKKDCPTIRMIVIYTGDIERRQVSDEYNIGAVRVKLEPAFLSELDSEGIFRHLKEKVEKNESLDDEELMEFIILPLSFREKEERKEKIRETVRLAAQIQDRSQQLFALAGILTFTDKLIDMETANQIRRRIEMTKVGWIIEQEKQQILAKAEEEKQQMLAKAEEEKQQILAEVEEEKRQAARESVIKMIRKNYPTEEIAFIVSSFSWDDIEAVRREIAEAE